MFLFCSRGVCFEQCLGTNDKMRRTIDTAWFVCYFCLFLFVSVYFCFCLFLPVPQGTCGRRQRMGEVSKMVREFYFFCFAAFLWHIFSFFQFPRRGATLGEIDSLLKEVNKNECNQCACSANLSCKIFQTIFACSKINICNNNIYQV